MKFYKPGKSPVVLMMILAVFIMTGSIFGQNMFRKVNDFDGDGKADFAVTRSDANGLKYWWIRQTSAGVKVVQFGLGSDRNASGDYDGDGKADIAVWRPAATNGNSSTYYILESLTNTFRFQSFFNFIVSSPMHQDYNGDGKTDPGVVTGEINRGLNIVYSGSNTNVNYSLPPNHIFGIRLGDIDGDGGSEAASYTSVNNTNTVVTKNLVTNTTKTTMFGSPDDMYQAADFDGDGKGDLTIWRQTDGTWWWIRSSDNVVQVAQWGTIGDVPVPADYDGDGKTDLAIYRRGSQSVYWIYGSQNGVSAVSWGTSTDFAATY